MKPLTKTTSSAIATSALNSLFLHPIFPPFEAPFSTLLGSGPGNFCPWTATGSILSRAQLNFSTNVLLGKKFLGTARSLPEPSVNKQKCGS